MSRKFNGEVFMRDFLVELEAKFNERGIRSGFPFVSLSRIAFAVCKKNNFQKWANRDEMNRLIQVWYRSLPEGKYASYTKSLFGYSVVPANAMGASFIWLESSWLGSHSTDFINFIGKEEVKKPPYDAEDTMAEGY